MSAQNPKRGSTKKKGKNKLIKTFAIVLAIVVIVLGIIGGTYWNLAVKPVDKNNAELVLFEFGQDENIRNVSSELQEKGIIKSKFALRSRLKSEGIEYIVKPGKYNFSASMSMKEIINIIAEGRTAYDYVMVIDDGMDMDKIIWDFSEDEAQFQSYTDKLNDLSYIADLRTMYPFLPEEIEGEGFRHRLEGFLGNGNYYLKEDTTLEEYIELALANFQKEYDARGIEAKLQEQNKSLFDVVTMAALVRGEVMHGDYTNQSMVAGVFYNRLNIGMQMQSDVTVGYSLGKKDTNYTMEELGNPSPYNTYWEGTIGLPRGPINNPEFGVIEAVLNPTPSNYLFFLADICDDGKGEFGEIYYSENETQHNTYAREYLECIY